jgi:hypothetical protein
MAIWWLQARLCSISLCCSCSSHCFDKLKGISFKCVRGCAYPSCLHI